MEIVKSDVGEVKSPKYDASRRYSWTPEDTFTLTGQEFGILLNTIRGILGTPEAAKVLMAKDANDAIEKVLANAVEAGIVKEAPEVQKP